MSEFDFDAQLRRAFAETPDPVDAGFAMAVSGRVAGLERRRLIDRNARRVGYALAAAAAGFGFISLAGAASLDMMATVGLGLAKAHGSLSQVEISGGDVSQGLLGLGLTQVMMVGAALAGGVAALRTVRG